MPPWTGVDYLELALVHSFPSPVTSWLGPGKFPAPRVGPPDEPVRFRSW